MSHLNPRLLVLLLLLSSVVHAQREWAATGTPRSSRYDDIYFINDSIGWAAGGDRKILHTRDAGATWQLQFTATQYLRSIEFPTAKLGFCGSLDSALYRTEDGGLTWTDVSRNIQPRPSAICGLAAPDSLNIYGCGAWRTPAFIVKSSDGGRTWNYIDMTMYASRLVDIHFISKDTGFVTGTANPESEGGIVLYTTNGGRNWEVKFKTMMAEDIIWKIQTPDNIHYFGSVSSLPNRPARILRSVNKGATWSSVLVHHSYYDLEMVGFTDRFTGWTGGRSALFKTTDGGQTWSSNLVSDQRGFNRFFRVNAQSVYLSGSIVYKLRPNAFPPGVEPPTEHTLRVLPNPVKGSTRIELTLVSSTFVELSLYTSDGKRLMNLIREPLSGGAKDIRLNLNQYPAGTYFLVLRTNEGRIHTTVVKQ